MFRDLQLLVPIQYKYGLAATQASDFEYELFDGDPNTSGEFNGGTLGQTSLTLINSAMPTWLFVDGEAQQGTTLNTGAFVVERSATALSMPSYHAEYGESANWTIAGVPDAWTSFKRAITGTERLSLMVSLTNATAGTVYGVDIQGGFISPSGTKLGYVFSKDFNFQLWNRDKRCAYSFNVESERSNTGNSFDDWQEARSRQMARLHTFQWNELTETKLEVFFDFLDAFGGNIEQPFIIARRYSSPATNFECEFYRLIISEKSISYSKNKGGTFELSFSARELSIDY